jgi:hypothetical protein
VDEEDVEAADGENGRAPDIWLAAELKAAGDTAAKERPRGDIDEV